jgi:hypothetical protein
MENELSEDACPVEPKCVEHGRASGDSNSELQPLHVPMPFGLGLSVRHATSESACSNHLAED